MIYVFLDCIGWTITQNI